ncbi:MAG: hypothetical protein P1V97_00385 [Planctomycetota bacterium]|nr:hypothetical protein [Planctomycetota bacterium]
MINKTFLDRVQEPMFDKKISFNCEAYRFIWTRTFHNLIILRVVNEAGMVRFSAKELKRDEQLSLARHEVFEVSAEQWQSLIDEVEKHGLWSYEPTRKGGIDGAHWQLECLRYGQFQELQEWCPDQKNPLRQFCMSLLTLSRFELEESEIY